MERVITYIDGFNLYFALKESNWQRYYWLDLPELSRNIIKPDRQSLVGTKYFTSRISGSLSKTKRQSTYLDALKAEGETEIFYGQYRNDPHKCTSCKRTDWVPNEKMTDVSLAVEMIMDAVHDRFDTAILIGGDTDLVPPVEKIRSEYPQKRVIVAFPPNRVNDDLKYAANGFIVIGRAKFAKSVLPPTVYGEGGFPLECPDSWR
jgi:uncharacterized LabA/DUF88 family protein